MKGKINLNENKLQSLVSECITEVLNEMKEEKKNKKINESKKPVRINESQLQSLIKESTLRILKESEMDEGFWDNMKAGWQGAKAGFNTQKSLDSDYSNLKQEHDYDDTLKTMNNPMKKMPKTAAESSEDLLKQAQYYQKLANQLRARANAIDKKYALQKTGVNQRAAATQTQPSSVPNVNGMRQPSINPVTKNRPNPNKNLNPLGL